MKAKAMKLGQTGGWKEEGTWLFITHQDGEYLLWSEEEDEEFREMFEIDPKQMVARVKVNRFTTPARNAYTQKVLRRYTQRGNTPPPQVVEKAIRDSVAHTVLEDWEGLALEDGSIVKYSPEVGAKVFKDDDMFYQAIVAVANQNDYHRAKAIQQDADALGEASGGT